MSSSSTYLSETSSSSTSSTSSSSSSTSSISSSSSTSSTSSSTSSTSSTSSHSSVSYSSISVVQWLNEVSVPVYVPETGSESSEQLDSVLVPFGGGVVYPTGRYRIVWDYGPWSAYSSGDRWQAGSHSIVVGKDLVYYPENWVTATGSYASISPLFPLPGYSFYLISPATISIRFDDYPKSDNRPGSPEDPLSMGYPLPHFTLWRDGDLSSSSLSSLSSSSSSRSLQSGSTPSSSTIFTNSSNSSSSTVHDNFYVCRTASYILDCCGMASFGNPETGRSAGVIYRGGFDVVSPNYSPSYGIDNRHLVRGGLRKTSLNNGVIYCQDASKIMNMSGGNVRLRLNLPESIVNGVYDPLSDQSSMTLTDYLIWGVNVGDYYITPPGFYAALTPSGIEFTVWTSGGKYTAIDTQSNVLANTDFVIDFAWSQEGIAIYLDDVLTASVPSVVSQSSLSGVSFWCLDSQSGAIGLKGILRRLEVYTSSPSRVSAGINHSSELSSRHYDDKIITTGRADLPFSFIGVNGARVEISVQCLTVAKMPIDLKAVGCVGADGHRYGSDYGADNKNIPMPIPLDLPPGIVEVYRP